MQRVLTAFRRDRGELAEEWRLDDLDVNELRAMFDRPGDDPMYDEYRVLPEHVEAIERAIGERLDLDTSSAQRYSRSETNRVLPLGGLGG